MAEIEQRQGRQQEANAIPVCVQLEKCFASREIMNIPSGARSDLLDKTHDGQPVKHDMKLKCLKVPSASAPGLRFAAAGYAFDFFRAFCNKSGESW
jgi:hypothetical protein